MALVNSNLPCCFVKNIQRFEIQYAVKQIFHKIVCYNKHYKLKSLEQQVLKNPRNYKISGRRDLRDFYSSLLSVVDPWSFTWKSWVYLLKYRLVGPMPTYWIRLSKWEPGICTFNRFHRWSSDSLNLRVNDVGKHCPIW